MWLIFLQNGKSLLRLRSTLLYRIGLNRHDKLNLSDAANTDWEEANNTSCGINTDYKFLWVINSNNYIYKRNALNRAKKVRQRN